MESVKIILALGSNTRQADNMGKAQAALRDILPDIQFSENLWTQPVGKSSDLYMNCLATATTCLPMGGLQAALKQIERTQGDLSHREGTVNIDIDILQYGSLRCHEEDWSRDYIRQLLALIRKKQDI